MPLRLFNTLSRKKEIFKPRKKDFVTFYACGPTVYQRAHIGNFRTYINEDVLKRALILNNFKVKHVMNITDVGHLERDSDMGEDKIEKEAREQNKSAWVIAHAFESLFKKDLRKLNIIFPDKFTRATEHIDDQINMIKKLEKRGYVYKTSDGVYFDTSKFKKYGELVKAKIKGIRFGARVGMRDKRNPTDFALWKFSIGVKRQMEWPSPWGKGFPGWHIECSAMATKYLGIPIDIHAGGIDHIHPHHTNELAQSEAAFGKKFVNYWMHSEFLRIGKSRIGKSEGNAISISDLENRGFDATDFRYMAFSAQYRSPLSFTWESLAAARKARRKLENKALNASRSDEKVVKNFEKSFLAAVNDDLNIPKALALVWKAHGKDEILFADRVLGLGLVKHRKVKADTKLKELLKKREILRKDKKWRDADRIRAEILKLGYKIEDASTGPMIKKVT